MMTDSLRSTQKLVFVFFCVIFADALIATNSVSALKLEDYIAQYKNENVKMTKDSLNFYDLTAKDYTDPNNPFDSSSKYFYKGKLIVTDEYGAPVFDKIEVSDDYPRSGLKTIIIPTHGGMTAHGWAYHVFVLSSDALEHTIFETELSCSDKVIAGNGLIDIIQHSMSCPLTMKGDLGISFYTAVHPEYSRYYIYDNGKWRHGEIGELNEYYDMLFNQSSSMQIIKSYTDSEKHNIDIIGAKVAEEVYYCIMSGRTDSVCKKHMNTRLPKKMKWITDSFFATVKEDTEISDYDIETDVYR